MMIASPSKANHPPQNTTAGEKADVINQLTAATAVSSPAKSTKPLDNFSLSGLRLPNSHHIHKNSERFPDKSGEIPKNMKNKGKAVASSNDVDGAGDPNYNSDVVNEEIEHKTWNLRPRKQGQNGGEGAANIGAGREIKALNPRRPEVTRVRIGVDARMAAETRERMRFSISLTKEEIEKDFLLMTGAKPSRRPKRRCRRDQKEIDHLYPGLWFESPLPDIYKFSEYLKNM